MGYDPKKTKSGIVRGIRSRPDAEYPRHLVGASASTADQAYWSPDGYCEKPYVEPYVGAPTPRVHHQLITPLDL